MILSTLFNYQGSILLSLILILPIITIVWYHFSSDVGGAVLILVITANIVAPFVILFILYDLLVPMTKEVDEWIEKDLLFLFLEKRPLHTMDETAQNGLWDEIVLEVNLKIDQKFGIHNMYSRKTLIDYLNDRINKTSESLKEVASSDIIGRNKTIMIVKEIRDKDSQRLTERLFSEEEHELQDILNNEAYLGKYRDTMKDRQ